MSTFFTDDLKMVIKILAMLAYIALGVWLAPDNTSGCDSDQVDALLVLGGLFAALGICLVVIRQVIAHFITLLVSGFWWLITAAITGAGSHLSVVTPTEKDWTVNIHSIFGWMVAIAIQLLLYWLLQAVPTLC